MNKVILQGNLGAEPDFRTAEGKMPVCSFSVATNERKRAKAGETVEITEWHRVVTFGKTAELCSKYLKKGDSTLIEGRIKSSRFKDREGKEQTSFQIVANNVRFLSKRSDEVTTANDLSDIPEEEEANF
jgi:single-strand DNA-binding protein